MRERTCSRCGEVGHYAARCIAPKEAMLDMSARHLRNAEPIPRMPKTRKGRPYILVTVSFYVDALGDLDGLVDAIQTRGVTRASRSSVIRAAVAHFGALDPAVADALVRTLPEYRGES